MTGLPRVGLTRGKGNGRRNVAQNVLRAVEGVVLSKWWLGHQCSLPAASARHLWFSIGFFRPGNQAYPLGVLHFRSWKLLFGEVIPASIVVPNSAPVKGLLTPETSGK
jgi:hypothetical protein